MLIFFQVQQELPAQVNASASPAPVLTRDVLHNKMEELEEQLLSKIISLQKERSGSNSNHDQQRHDIEKELSALQSRVTELEQGQCWQVKLVKLWLPSDSSHPVQCVHIRGCLIELSQ